MPTTGLILAAVCVTLSIYSTSGQTNCSTNNTLRLYNPNGNTTTEGGMLQICRSGIWRAACDYSFGCNDDGKAACRQLGYSGSQMKSVVLLNSAQYYGSWSYTDTYYYSCSSSSTSLTNCSKNSVSSYYCNSDDQVGLGCMTLPQTACTNRAVRLVGGASSNEGILEYCYNGAWSPVCYRFQDKEAIVACKQLGFSESPKVFVVTDGRFGLKWRFSSFYYISCPSSGLRSSLASCTQIEGSTCGYRCTLNYGIICYGLGHDGCTEGSVRLVNSTIEYEGRVEVCVDGVWGTVCGVDAPDANALCHVAGYAGVIRYFTTSEMFGDGDRPIVYQLRCYGCETNITHCNKNVYPNLYCNRQSIAGVRCRHGCTDGDIRLTGGGSETEGTVEICHEQTWGMVSGLGWGDEDARVTCRQLQLPEDGFKYYYDSPFEKLHQFTIHFSGVKCTGNEARIADCGKNVLTFEEGKKLVDHTGVAGVSCKRNLTSSCPSFITKTITVHALPSQQVQSSTDSGHVTATVLLAVISGTLATVTVALAVCMCYFLHKNGKNKQSSTSTQGQRSENQYGKQPGDSNTNPVTFNQSYGKLTPATPSFDEDPAQTTYEVVSMCQ